MPNKDEIIKRLINNSAEIITNDEFTERINSGDQLTHYIGFEISGYVHIGQGIMSALVMKDLTDLGVKCTVWLADWHTWINDKLDGTKETAAKIGQGYFTEAIEASYLAVGGNPDDLEFRLASEWYAKQPAEFWDKVMQVSKNTSLSRMLRSIDVMGRQAGDAVDHARTMYPAMQVADIFFQNIDIAHSGMDQRKAHVVMRDVADKVHPDKPKPIALHHPLLLGLKKFGTIKDDNFEEEFKMSKSDPSSAIFVHDSTEEIEQKISDAFCPPGGKDTRNPVLEWAQHILFWNRGERPFTIVNAKEGGQKEFITFQELEDAYSAGGVHPADLKAAVAKELIELLAPVREHFAKPAVAAHKADLDKVLQSQ